MKEKTKKRKVKFKTPKIKSEQHELIQKAIRDKNFKFEAHHEALVIESLETASTYQKLTLLAIELRGGWNQFKCGSMKGFLTKHFEEEYSTLNRRLVAARVAHRIGGFKMVGKFHDDPLFQMNNLTKEDCERVLKCVEKKSGTPNTKKSVTKKLVVEAMIALDLKKPPTEAKKDPVLQLKAILNNFNSSEHSLEKLAATLKNNFKKNAIRKLIKALKTSG